MSFTLLRSAVAAVVREVGSFDSHASPLVVLEFGGNVTLRVPVTPDEARAFGSRLNEIVSLRLAVEAPPAKETP